MKTSKYFATIILLLVALSCFSQPNAKGLQQAYRNTSVTGLKLFFENWRKQVPPIGNDEYSRLNDTLKQAYNVFTAFYQPLNIKAMGGSEWGNKIYQKVNYLIIQNSLSVYTRYKIYTDGELDSMAVGEIKKSGLTDSLKQRYLMRNNGKLANIVLQRFTPDNLYDGNKDVLVSKTKDFRPIVNCGNKRPLYLTPEYDTILNAFLGNTNLALGSGGIMNPSRSAGESVKRQRFLENFIKIWYGHWGGYWQLKSYPEATSIVFDKNMKYAIVNFRMVYEGGEAILENINGIWKLLSSKRTWIE